ncbi:MAG: alpha/beta fold hydrolase, partial [Patescibacteria group bacterium]
EDYYAPYALNNFKGVIDDVWIRSESLDDSKILEIFQSAKPYKSEITETALAPIAVKAIYHFDDTGDTASDSSGNGYNLSWGANPWGGGEPSPRRVSGRFDKAINFNKVEDLFSRNVDPPVNFENGISAGAWIKTGAQSDPGARFLVLGGNNKENNIVLSEKLGQAFLTVNFSDGCTATTNGPACFYRTYNITSSQSINDNNWHFISFTFDPRAHNHTLKLYIDGEEEGSEFIPGNPPSFGQVKVGYREDNSCGRFCNFMGDVDDLFILSSILSPEEVKQIYESGQPFAWPLVKEKDPVIIVPGILGSWQSLNIKLIDPILHTYDNLIEALIQSGYELDKNLFVFPYNWRQNNVTTAGQLKDKIQEIKEITGKTKVDIVAHSMGGLVARYYVQSSEYQNDVDQLIFLGTPHKGAPEDYLAWEGSYFLANNWLLNSVLGLEAAEHKYLNIIKYIHEQAPSVEQLLPTYNYLQNKLGDSWIDRIYPVQYPRNEFLENLNTQAGISALKGRANIINIFSHSLKANTTVSKIRVISDPDIYDSKWMDGYPENLDDGNADCLILGDGDRTVPNESSNSLAGVKTIELSGYDHRQMVTAAQKEVIKELTGKTPDKYIDSLWSAIKRIFFIRVYSPVDFTIIAPDGKRLGKDFFSNTDLNEIDGAFYSGFGAEEEFATILEPMDGEYKIEIQGVSRGGQYQLGTSLINTDNESEIEKNYQGNIAENQVQEFRINYSSTSDNPLSDPEPIDLVAPTINITSPAEGSNYLHNATMQIEYSATDDFSGISATSTLLDGQSVDNEKADLFFLKTGEHLLEFRALDKAGNMATSTVKFNITATPDSVISDIQRLYNLRWIYDRITSKLLITEIEEI